MILEIEINPNEDPNLCGELLLRDMNKDDRWGYMTDELTNGWHEQHKSTASLGILTLLQGCEAKEVGNKAVICVHNQDNQIKVYLYWDGDGSIVFDVGGELLYNGDMKKSYGWDWNPDWAKDYWTKYKG